MYSTAIACGVIAALFLACIVWLLLRIQRFNKVNAQQLQAHHHIDQLWRAVQVAGALVAVFVGAAVAISVAQYKGGAGNSAAITPVAASIPRNTLTSIPTPIDKRTVAPTSQATVVPTSQPTVEPTLQATAILAAGPSAEPTSQPTTRPIVTPVSKVASVSSLLVQSNGSTRVLDLGSTPRQAPQNWNLAGFDDSTWDYLSTVAPSVLSCVQKQVTSWGEQPAYWGVQEDHYYLVRQSFLAPHAASYDGSVLRIAFTSGSGSEPTLIFLNGQEVTNGAILGGDGLYNVSIAGQLRPGQNVLSLYAVPESSSVTDSANNRCSSLNFSATIRTSMTASIAATGLTSKQATPVMQSNESTRVDDLGSTPQRAPQNWNIVGFDDSA